MEEESEFRDMILKEINNTSFMIAKRAELRAYLYSIIDNNKQIQHSSAVNNSDDSNDNELNETNSITLNDTHNNHKKQKYDRDVLLALNLVQELLDSLNCKYTNTVLKSEIGRDNSSLLIKTKQEMAAELNLTESLEDEECESTDNAKPLLLTLIQKQLRNISSD